MNKASDITTRHGSPSDISAVMELERRVDTAAHWGRLQYEAVFQPEPRRVMLVAIEAHEVRGFLVASATGSEWEIENVVVDRASRRRGFGRRLLNDLVCGAREGGAEAIFLEVRESNEAARRLYEKCGFLQTGRRTGYFKGPNEDAILYRLSTEQIA